MNIFDYVAFNVYRFLSIAQLSSSKLTWLLSITRQHSTFRETLVLYVRYINCFELRCTPTITPWMARYGCIDCTLINE